MKLARHLLSKFTQQASNPESKSITEKDILGMMERFGLIAKFADEIYFVPAQLRSPSPEDLLGKEPTSFEPCPLYIDFPSGLYLMVSSLSLFRDASAGALKPVTSAQSCSTVQLCSLLESQ